MTEQSAGPLVRGLIDPEEVEDDGSDVEDATEALLRLRAERDVPERDGLAGRDAHESRDGSRSRTAVGDDRDAPDPT